MSSQIKEELSTACSVPNLVLNPTRETKNNVVFPLEEFTIFLEQQYLVTKTIKCCSPLSIVNSSMDEPYPVRHDSWKQSEGQGGKEGSDEPRMNTRAVSHELMGEVISVSFLLFALASCDQDS